MIARREDHPRHGQVGRRITGADVAEVNHGHQLPIGDQQVQRVQIAVQPHGRGIPHGRCRELGECGSTPVGVDLRAKGAHALLEPLRSIGERHATKRIVRRIVRRRTVQASEKGSESASGASGLGRGCRLPWFTGKPRHDRP